MGEWRRIYYPDRKKTRHFSAKDVARISKYAVRDGSNAMEVFVAVAVAVGFGKLLCDAARVTRSFISITHWFKELAVILGTAQLINQILAWLNGASVIAPFGIKIFVGIAIALTLVIEKLVLFIDSITGDIAIAHDISVQIDDACRKADELAQQAFDATCDATGDACETAKQAAKDAAWLLKSEHEKAIEALGQEQYPKWWEWL